MSTKKPPTPPPMRFKSLRPIKLKDKVDRNYIPVKIKEVFGFYPEVIIIEKVRGANNKIVVHAILTPEEIKKEDKLIKAEKMKAKLLKKPDGKK